jgi:hypothetical protein
MLFPIAVQKHAGAKDCPFYCQDKAGQYGCILKHITGNNTWLNAVANSQDDNFLEEYSQDCEGEFGKCCYANLLWTNAIEDEDVSEGADDMNNATEVKVSIHKIDNPYMVKTDVLIYPTNNLLQIDDPLLNKMSRNKVQEECDNFKTNVSMGQVYITSGGYKHDKGVQASKIYHAVVAGESRLVNEHDITKAILSALIMADENKAEIVTMLPADCGTYDINQAAFHQLKAVYQFLTEIGVEHIRYIFIVMNDEDSNEAFIDNFSLIFSSEDS